MDKSNAVVIVPAQEWLAWWKTGHRVAWLSRGVRHAPPIPIEGLKTLDSCVHGNYDEGRWHGKNPQLPAEEFDASKMESYFCPKCDVMLPLEGVMWAMRSEVQQVGRPATVPVVVGSLGGIPIVHDLPRANAPLASGTQFDAALNGPGAAVLAAYDELRDLRESLNASADQTVTERVQELLDELKELRVRSTAGVRVKTGYENLWTILVKALEQAQTGKGTNRHGHTGATWDRQTINAIPMMLGSVAPQAYQICKKATEAVGLVHAGNLNQAEEDALGIIVYAASLVFMIGEMR